MVQKYKEIEALLGVEEFKSLVLKWLLLSENIVWRDTKPKIVLPDLLWVMNSGVGRTSLLNHLAEFLYESNTLMEFSGNVKFFEFLLKKTGPDIKQEMQRFMSKVSEAAGFRNVFRGVVCIDINEWAESYKDKDLVSFLEMLSAHNEEWLIILSVRELEETKITNLEAFLSKYLRIETINIKMPSTEDMLTYIKQKLSLNTLTLYEESEEVLKQSIEKLRKNESFDGFKTLDFIVQDIVYEHFCNSGSPDSNVGFRIIDKFGLESEYINKFEAKAKEAKKLGF